MFVLFWTMFLIMFFPYTKRKWERGKMYVNSEGNLRFRCDVRIEIECVGLFWSLFMPDPVIKIKTKRRKQLKKQS